MIETLLVAGAGGGVGVGVGFGAETGVDFGAGVTCPEFVEGVEAGIGVGDGEGATSPPCGAGEAGS